VHLDFGDFLSAILTADAEIRPNDAASGFREELRKSFLAYGIKPASAKPSTGEPGLWQPAEARSSRPLTYSRTRFESLTRDPDEVHPCTACERWTASAQPRRRGYERASVRSQRADVPGRIR